MTTGQRIAQKRKELGLSQEALGEQMGVSRQAIYKWEADQTLPEIEKLVALSKYFGTTVGWLLGVEEEASPLKKDDAELTPTQMQMVSEIVDRYINAQPKPKKRKKWPFVAAACLLVVVFIQLFGRMDQLGNQYNNVQNAISNISSSVNTQIGSIANRVEEILKAQNNLTAEYEADITAMDYRAGTATLTMRSVPKTFVDGMTACFVVDNGIGVEEFPCALSESTVFTAEAEVKLTDNITASVAFITPDGVRQTQLLENFYGYLSDSYPILYIGDGLMYTGISAEGKLMLHDRYVTAYESAPMRGNAEVVEYRLGIFRNQKLITWVPECEKPANYQGYSDDTLFFQLPEITLKELGTEETIEVAALVTDSYGRQYMCYDIPYRLVSDSDGRRHLTWADYKENEYDPGKWEFE